MKDENREVSIGYAEKTHRITLQNSLTPWKNSKEKIDDKNRKEVYGQSKTRM